MFTQLCKSEQFAKKKMKKKKKSEDQGGETS